MTSIDNALFYFKRIKDTYVLINRTLSTLSYSLTIGNCDGTSPTIKEGELIAEDTLILSLTKDGKYELNVEGTIVHFSHWKGLRTDLIPLIKQALCTDCGCSSTSCLPKEAIDCLRNQSLFNYILTYQQLVKPFSISTPILINPIIFNFIERVIQENSCSFRKELCKQLLETCVSGQPNTNKELFNYHIAVSYLALYNYDVQAIDPTVLTGTEVTEELIYLDKVYDFKCIEKCINKLGLNLISELVPDVSDLLVYYWQLENLTDDITEVAALLTDAYLDTQLSQNFAIFKDGYTVNYTDVGRAVFVVKPTALQNFLITDSMGLDITDNFDNQYFPSLEAVLFVSKDVVIPSNLHFKFKTIFDD